MVLGERCVEGEGRSTRSGEVCTGREEKEFEALIWLIYLFRMGGNFRRLNADYERCSHRLQRLWTNLSSPNTQLTQRPFLSLHDLSPAQAKEFASKMLGEKLITKQTGEAGRICNAVMLAERTPPVKEYYVAVLADRTSQSPVLVASAQG